MNEGRNPANIRRVLSDGLAADFISPQLLYALQDLKQGFDKGKFRSNASSKEAAIVRTETILRGLPDASELATNYTSYRDADSLGGEGTEAYFRVRLLSEINACQKSGGVILPDGRVERDVVGAVITVVKELKPELGVDLLTEGSLGEKRI